MMQSEVITPTTHLSLEKIPTVIYEDSGKASKVVAREIADIIINAQRKGKNAVLGLATGSTPIWPIRTEHIKFVWMLFLKP